ncbi:MAG: NADPH-dependent reductase [Proteobacteria bacterium]|nr:NADPH-dependent reductase [Pseudomonadota bacterium]
MKLVILDGTAGQSAANQCIGQVASQEGATITHFALADLMLAPCLGDFECWTKTPGRCRSQDEAQDIAQAIHDADLLIFLTPLVFGGYSSALKRAVDRLIPLIDSFFHQRAGLTRHLPRYAKYPALLCIALSEQPNAETQSIFAELAGGNAINLLAPSYRSLVVSLRDGRWPEAVTAAVRASLRRAPGEALPVPAADALALACAADPFDPRRSRPPRTASILIGSARPKGQSTSESLARGLAAGLERAGVKTSLVRAISFVKDGHRADKALATLLGGELLVIAAPLYVDALPSLATHALERLGEQLGSQPHQVKSVVGIINCGFPEAVHNRTALRILRAFAQASGLNWGGGLAMGAGEILHGKPLSAARFVMRAQSRALALAARDLAAGRGISPEASQQMARPLLPAFLFRWVAPFKWILQARSYGVSWTKLHERPLDETVSITYSEIAGFRRAK